MNRNYFLLSLKRNIFYYLGYLLIVVPLLINVTEVSNWFQFYGKIAYGFVYIGILLLSFVFVMQSKYTLYEYYFLFLIFVLIIIVGLNTNFLVNLLSLFFIIVSAKNVNLRFVFILHLAILLSIMTSIFLFTRLGLVPNRVTYAFGKGFRNTLGYKYTSFGPNLYFHLILIYGCVRNKVKISELLLLLSVSIYFYIKTLTISAFIFSLLAISTLVIFKYNIFYKVNWKKISTLCLCLCAIIPIYLTIQYINNLDSNLLLLDRVLSNRLNLGAKAFLQFPITLFGQVIYWQTQFGIIGFDYLYVDSSTINIFLNYGVVFFIVIFVALTTAILRKSKVRNIVWAMLSIFFLHSMWDPQLIEFWVHPFLLIITRLLNNKSDFL